MSKNHRILITGSNGLLGQKLVSHLVESGDHLFLATSRGVNRIEGIYDFEYAEMDICDPEQVSLVFEKFKPTAVINTAAYTQVDHCEHDVEACNALNVEGVRNLIQACVKVEAKLIHLSTDFVFDGEKGNYIETDKVNPLSVYAQSKLDSEELIQSSALSDWAIARTIIIYGVTHKMSRSNLVLWAVKALKAGQEINVVDDQYRSPTLAEDLAKACVQMIEHDVQGVYHVSGPETASIYELVHQVADSFALNKDLISPITTASLNQKASRPPKTGFDISKAQKDFDYNPMTFKEGLEIVKEHINKES
ncbi:MAG: dTDP-4-dehydrorhamnose reductase [Glaciecola sp.]|jgi:dTDP-4-dehydrorhamnose reductase